MPKVLFICTGNTCRSPMAEQLFNKLAQDNLEGWEALSAGLAPFLGQTAAEHVFTILKEEGIDVSGHSSKQLTEDIIKEVDLILTMTGNHKGFIIDQYPEYMEKVFTLKEFALQGENNTEEVSVSDMDFSYHDKLDIFDPYGQSEDVYRMIKDEIKDELRKVLVKLNHFNFEAGKLNKMENNNYRGDIVKIAVGSDHAGYDLKMEIAKYLKEEGYEFIDMGTDSSESVDYPDYGYKVARAVADGEYDKGILVCGTGIGMSITANKIKGIRAALCHDVFSAKATRNHNNSNVLTIGSRVVGNGLALEIVKVWLGEDFDDGRHQNRIDKISKIERGEG